MEEFVIGENDRFTKDALREQDGKTVPLRLCVGGPIVGEATLKYVEEGGALMANLHFDDPKTAELLKGTLSSMSIPEED